MKINLGKVMILPWDNLFPLFENKIENMESGGYHIESNKVFILASTESMSVSQITLPTPQNNFDLPFIMNDKLVEQKNFGGTLNVEEGSSILIQTVYEV